MWQEGHLSVVASSQEGEALRYSCEGELGHFRVLPRAR